MFYTEIKKHSLNSILSLHSRMKFILEEQRISHPHGPRACLPRTSDFVPIVLLDTVIGFSDFGLQFLAGPPK